MWTTCRPVSKSCLHVPKHHHKKNPNTTIKKNPTRNPEERRVHKLSDFVYVSPIYHLHVCQPGRMCRWQKQHDVHKEEGFSSITYIHVKLFPCMCQPGRMWRRQKKDTHASSKREHVCLQSGSFAVRGCEVAGGGARCTRIFQVNEKIPAQIFGTRGLISADRRTKPTLMLTIPRSLLSRLQRIYRPQR